MPSPYIAPLEVPSGVWLSTFPYPISLAHQGSLLFSGEHRINCISLLILLICCIQHASPPDPTKNTITGGIVPTWRLKDLDIKIFRVGSDYLADWGGGNLATRLTYFLGTALGPKLKEEVLAQSSNRFQFTISTSINFADIRGIPMDQKVKLFFRLVNFFSSDFSQETKWMICQERQG